MSRRVLLVAALALLSACRAAAPPAAAPPLAFDAVTVSETAKLWWARAVADLDGDGLLDVALQDDNGHGGWLGWLRAADGGRRWALHVIAERAPDGQTFAAGDLAAGDLDADGDADVLAFAHPGEWDEGGAPTQIYWYENAGGGTWTPHHVGTAPAFVKDVDLADFDGDGRLDVVAITYVQNNVSVFRQDAAGGFTKVLDVAVENLHEGMDVGDLDGDGDPDVAANGYWLENPGPDLTAAWTVRSIADRWHDQDGDWSKNATKISVYDLDGDGRAEVFISHSERAGYPLAWYESDDPRGGGWTEHVVAADWPAAQSMQVADVDLDGDADVVAGVNRTRAEALGETSFPVTIFLNDGGGAAWTRHEVSDGGIYNGQLGDVDGDGDPDLFRLPAHDAETFELLLNRVR